MAQQVMMQVERIVHTCVGHDETLRGCESLESPSVPLASSDAEMRVLRPVVVAQSSREISVAEV